MEVDDSTDELFEKVAEALSEEISNSLLKNDEITNAIMASAAATDPADKLSPKAAETLRDQHKDNLIAGQEVTSAMEAYVQQIIYRLLVDEGLLTGPGTAGDVDGPASII